MGASASVAILVPMLGRPSAVAPLLESIEASTPANHRTLFVCTPGDPAVHAVMAAGGEHIAIDFAPGDYARKINAGIAATTEPYIFTGASDLRFHPGWFEAALAKLDATAGVIGTNDLGNSRVLKGEHSTHSVLVRTYIEAHGTIDGPGAMHEGYRHNFCDTEMVQTAKVRGAWRFARKSIVEHLHPNWLKGQTDSTYDLGRSGFSRDQTLYHRRRCLWET